MAILGAKENRYYGNSHEPIYCGPFQTMQEAEEFKKKLKKLIEPIEKDHPEVLIWISITKISSSSAEKISIDLKEKVAHNIAEDCKFGSSINSRGCECDISLIKANKDCPHREKHLKAHEKELKAYREKMEDQKENHA